MRRAPALLIVWTWLVWTTRIRNIWGDDALTDSEKWGRTALALSFTMLAIAAGWALVRRSARLPATVGLLAGWTTVVWAVRAVGIVAGDHDAAFVIVHLALAVVSMALAGLAWRVVTVAPPADATPAR